MNNVIDNRLAVREAETYPRKPPLDAVLTHIHQLAAHSPLVVDLGTTEAPLVNGQGVVEDVMRHCLQVQWLKAGRQIEALSVYGILLVANVGPVDHGFVDTSHPVLT